MVDFSTNSIYHGINWIYTFSETPFMYDFNISYNWFTNNIYQDTFDFNYYSFWYSTLDISYFTLFWSVMLDKFLVSNLFKLPFQDSWFKFLTQNYETSLLFINHPEYFFISDYIVKTLILPFSSNIDNIIYVLNDEENFLNPVLVLPHLIVIAMFVMFFISLYFS